MNREDKIKAIYKEIANKKLSFGCYVKTDNGELVVIEVEEYWIRSWIKESNWFVFKFGREDEGKYEIIWCPVMIWDVISYLRRPFDTFIEGQPIGENWLVASYLKNMEYLLAKRFDTSLSIDNQDDECIDFIYSLIRK